MQRRLSLLLSLALLVLLAPAFSLAQFSGLSPKPGLHVCIVGGGIGGASSAHWLRQSAALSRQFDLQLTLFEREDHLGGRVGDAHVGGERFENGASILHESNRYMQHFARLLNLTIDRDPHKLDPSMGLWNGREFVMELSGSTISDAITVLWRYGLDLNRLTRAVEIVGEKFGTVYRTQDMGFAFESPKELLSALGLSELTDVSLTDWLAPKLSSPLIVSELAAAAVRVNYNQAPGLVHALAGAVGLIPLTDSRLYAVAEGNARVVEGLVEREGVRVRLGHAVHSVRFTPDVPGSGSKRGRYTVSGQRADDGAGKAANFTALCDVVVLAAPIEFARDIHWAIPSDHVPPVASPGGPQKEWEAQPTSARKFQATHTTWVRGRLRSEPFGLPSDARMPGSILTVDPADPRVEGDFTSISAYAERDGLRTYKVFSRSEFDQARIDKYFAQVDAASIRRTPWLAYPRYSVPENFSVSFRLFAGHQIFSPAALEPMASCIEVSIVGARNVAALVAKEWIERARLGAVSSMQGAQQQQKDEL